MKRMLFVVPLAMALAADSFGATTVINGVIGSRTDLLNYCPGGVSTAKLEFQDSSGPFYASRNLTIAGLCDNWRTATLDLDADRVITLTGHMYGMTAGFVCKGGIYDFQNAYGFNTGAWDEWTQRAVGMTLDGAVFTNMPSVVLQNNGQKGGAWTLKNGARIYSAGVFQMAAWGVPATDLAFDMSSGAQVSCSFFETDGGASGRANIPRVLKLSGTGTKLSSRGADVNKIGRGFSRAEVHVSDHAELTLGDTTYLGLEPFSYCNALRVSGSAKANLGVVYLGCNGGGSNIVEVTGEAVVSTGHFYLNGGNVNTKGNTLVVSNATVNSTKLFSPQDKGSDSTIRVSGDHPKIRVDAGRSKFGTAFEMNRGVRMIFDIPRTGYVDDQIPIVVTGVYTDPVETPMGTYASDPSKLAIELNGVAACQEWLQEETELRKKRIVLLHVAGSIDGYGDAIAAVNETLPDKCKLLVTSGAKAGLASGAALVLEVGAHRGSILTVR